MTVMLTLLCETCGCRLRPTEERTCSNCTYYAQWEERARKRNDLLKALCDLGVGHAAP